MRGGARSWDAEEYREAAARKEVSICFCRGDIYKGSHIRVHMYMYIYIYVYIGALNIGAPNIGAPYIGALYNIYIHIYIYI